MGIEGEGMCHPKHRDLRGNLYFVFDVEFPEDSFLDQEGINVCTVYLCTWMRKCAVYVPLNYCAQMSAQSI